jgi:hypothetical protein
LEESWIGRGFSIEMESKRYVKNISISDEAHDRVLFEGNIGSLEELSMADERVLEIRGSNGLLRIDVTTQELEEMISNLRSKDARALRGRSYTNTKKEKKEKKQND